MFSAGRLTARVLSRGSTSDIIVKKLETRAKSEA